jgi:phospholipid/cholesterol/gamma-HCH transport system permease protein
MPATAPVSEHSPSSRADRAGPPVVTVRIEWPPQGSAGGLTGQFEEVGDLTLFALRAMSGAARRVGWRDLMPVSYAAGVGSVPVVALGGLCVGMVLAVQSFDNFHAHALENRLGAMIVNAAVRELGPLLAAVWLVARAGSAMTADLATLRSTGQVAALAGRGVDPVHALVTPRLLACLLVAPLLTVVACWAVILGGGLVCTGVYGVEAHFYWQHTRGCFETWDLVAGLLKSACFGGIVALGSCYCGFYAGEGPQGVGRAVTRACVFSLAAVLVLDYFLGLFLNSLYGFLYSTAGPRAVRFW